MFEGVSFKPVLALLFLFMLFFAANAQSGGDADIHKLNLKVENRNGLEGKKIKSSRSEDGWELITYVLQPGTRSEGYHGVLTHDGERVLGERGQKLDTPLGTLLYRGSMQERAHLWSYSGWSVAAPRDSSP